MRHKSITWYEKETGKIKARYYLKDVPGVKLPSRFPLRICETASSNNTVYLLDYWNQCIYICTPEGFQKSIHLKQFFSYGKCRNLIVNGDVVYILDTQNSNIAVFKEGVFLKWILSSQIGAEVITSFDVSNNEILVNDRYQGKTFKVFMPHTL